MAPRDSKYLPACILEPERVRAKPAPAGCTARCGLGCGVSPRPAALGCLPKTLPRREGIGESAWRKGRLWRSLRGGKGPGKLPQKGLGWLCHLNIAKEPLLKGPASVCTPAGPRPPGRQPGCEDAAAGLRLAVAEATCPTPSQLAPLSSQEGPSLGGARAVRQKSSSK